MNSYGRIGVGVAMCLVAWTACGPNKSPECRDPAPHPTFVVTVTLPGHTLPPDIAITVYYGGNTSGETYRLSQPSRPEVVFCQPNADAGEAGPGDAGPGDAGSSGEAGSAGAAGSAGERTEVDSITCSLWTDGPAEVRVTSSETAAFADPVSLSLHDGVCVFYETIELTPLDGG